MQPARWQKSETEIRESRVGPFGPLRNAVLIKRVNWCSSRLTLFMLVLALLCFASPPSSPLTVTCQYTPILSLSLLLTHTHTHIQQQQQHCRGVKVSVSWKVHPGLQQRCLFLHLLWQKQPFCRMSGDDSFKVCTKIITWNVKVCFSWMYFLPV